MFYLFENKIIIRPIKYANQISSGGGGGGWIGYKYFLSASDARGTTGVNTRRGGGGISEMNAPRDLFFLFYH